MRLTLEPSSFSLYDTVAKHWIFPDGKYEILAGTSSRDLPLHASITIGRRKPPDEGLP